jgi:Fe-S-cluster containining protein
MLTPVPPFEPGEEAVLGVPDQLLTAVTERIAADQQFEPLPCVWFNTQTRQCLHYQYRPSACRKFEIGSDLCRLSRWDMQIDT